MYMYVSAAVLVYDSRRPRRLDRPAAGGRAENDSYMAAGSKFWLDGTTTCLLSTHHQAMACDVLSASTCLTHLVLVEVAQQYFVAACYTFASIQRRIAVW